MSNGRFFNGSAEGRPVVQCPIVRDNVFNTNGTNRVLVNVITGGGGVSCRLRSLSALGAIIEDTAFKTIFSSGQIALDVNKSQGSGYYYVECELPRSTGIASYRADEP
jgi:hypothetical protein